MLLLTLFIACVLIVFALTAILNAFTFPRLQITHNQYTNNQSSHSLSVLIPARNEAAVIGQTVRALLAQPEVTELLILDDHSTDGTAAVAQEAANSDARLRVIAGQPLPAGWLGKNWACHQLSQAARGNLLLFTDADVIWQPLSINPLLSQLGKSAADLLTIWPTQITHTWAERLVVPLMALAIHAYLPVLAVHYLPWRAFSAAMGQCLLFRRAAYEKIGGHYAVRANIVEDVALAAHIKSAGLKLRMADGNHFMACRMYQNWPQVRAGYAKNILAGHGNQPALLLLSTLFHWIVFVLPWLLVFSYGLLGELENWRIWLPLGMLGILVRALTAASTQQRILDALFMPLSVCLMTLIAAQSLRWHFTGGPQWKGRSVKRNRIA
ncbi:MAG: glycosyltransferase [Anaerolineales bacterium]|nr:glycosyltransferase [Anaerolineales bacterium]